MQLVNVIGWCDATTNAVTGCTKVSEGCAHCYAERGTRARILRAQGVETWGMKGVRVPVRFGHVFDSLNRLTICERCRYTSARRAVGGACGMQFANHGPCPGQLRRIRLFADSNSDWLDPAWPDDVLCAFLMKIVQARGLDVILMTKRPGLFRVRVLAAARAANDPEARRTLEGWASGASDAVRHVWLGVSVENQHWADERVPALARMPAGLRFVAAEPLLGAVSLKPWLVPGGVNWVIVGMENGPARRDGGLDNLVRLVEEARAADVPVWVKQDTGHFQGQQGRIPDEIWRLKQTPRNRMEVNHEMERVNITT